MGLEFSEASEVEARRQLLVDLQGFCFDGLLDYGHGVSRDDAEIASKERVACACPAEAHERFRAHVSKKLKHDETRTSRQV